MTGYDTIAPMIPVPMISPMTAAQIFPCDARYKIPDKAAPKIAPVRASGGIPMTTMRIIPMRTATVKAYHGPNNTAAVMLMRCAIGHIPSIRKIGEMTTPRPISIAINTRRNTFLSVFIKKSTPLYRHAIYRSWIHITILKNIHSDLYTANQTYRSVLCGTFSTRNTGSLAMYETIQGAPLQSSLVYINTYIKSIKIISANLYKNFKNLFFYSIDFLTFMSIIIIELEESSPVTTNINRDS